MPKSRSHVEDLRGASRLAIEATRGITDLVEAMHHAIGGGPAVLGRPFEVPVRLLTAPVYGSIRAVTKLVGASIDVALAELAPLLGESAPGPEREAILAVLNGVLGDYLADTGNPLALEMHLRSGGRPLPLERAQLHAELPRAGRRLVVLVHGSCMSSSQWTRNGHDHGAALAREHGYTPLYLDYNSGLHISTNGRTFAALLDRLVDAWPEPVEEIVLLGHSMGGLVSRSACFYGALSGRAFPKVAKLLCLGSPHHGAPLERGGNWLDVLLQISSYSAPLARLGQIRSAGVTDLRFGNVRDEDWEGRDRFALEGDRRTPLPLPEGVACYAIAGSMAAAPGLADDLMGDGLVPVDSALGKSALPDLTLAFPPEHRWIAYGTGHIELLYRAEVYAKIAAWLA